MSVHHLSQGSNNRPVVGSCAPIAHPQNCKHECAYGYNRPFCFPCMKKIVEEQRAAKNRAKEV